MDDWELVKGRTASAGAVYRSADGLLYKRTGGPELADEVRFQRLARTLGYPVPPIVEAGQADGQYYTVERSLGAGTLHDTALRQHREAGAVGEDLIRAAADVSGQLLTAQIAHPQPAEPWFDRAAFLANVFAENPDLDTPRVHRAIEAVLERTAHLPMVHGHLDYGLPNMLPGGIIDWQHHGPVPLGYDVYPALEVVAFKGGNKGYTFSPMDRAVYTGLLDETAAAPAGQRLSGYLGDFLFVKCFFFLALMRPTDPRRRDKHLKWRYRRALFAMGLDQYESTRVIDVATFPTLERFRAEHGPGDARGM